MVLWFCSFPLVCTLSPGDSLHGLPYLWDLHPIPSPGMLLHILMGLKYLWKGRFPFLVDLSTCLSPTAYFSPQYFLSSSQLPWDISLISGLSMDSSSSMPFRSCPCSSFDSYTDLPTPISLRIPDWPPLCVSCQPAWAALSTRPPLHHSPHVPSRLCTSEHCSPFSSASPAQPPAIFQMAAWSFPIISSGTHPQFLWNPWHLLVPLLGYKYPYSC